MEKLLGLYVRQHENKTSHEKFFKVISIFTVIMMDHLEGRIC